MADVKLQAMSLLRMRLAINEVVVRVFPISANQSPRNSKLIVDKRAARKASVTPGLDEDWPKLLALSELAPAGLRPPKPVTPKQLAHRGASHWGCCAAQREQAPSPQVSLGLRLVWGVSAARRCPGRGSPAAHSARSSAESPGQNSGARLPNQRRVRWP